MANRFEFPPSGNLPVLVLLHGFPLNHRLWDQVVQPLAEAVIPVAVDLRGFGNRSRVLTENETPLQMSDYVDALLDDLRQRNIAPPVIVAGLSMGGYVALQWAAQNPEWIERLILCDTKAEADQETARQQRISMAEKLLAIDENLAPQQAAAMRDEICLAMLPKLLSQETIEHRPEVATAVRRMVDEIPLRGLANAQLAMANRVDTHDVVCHSPFPVNCICGENDGITPAEQMQKLALSAPQGTFHLIPSAGHLPPLEQPKLFTETLRHICQS